MNSKLEWEQGPFPSNAPQPRAAPSLPAPLGALSRRGAALAKWRRRHRAPAGRQRAPVPRPEEALRRAGTALGPRLPPEASGAGGRRPFALSRRSRRGTPLPERWRAAAAGREEAQDRPWSYRRRRRKSSTTNCCPTASAWRPRRTASSRRSKATWRGPCSCRSCGPEGSSGPGSSPRECPAPGGFGRRGAAGQSRPGTLRALRIEVAFLSWLFRPRALFRLCLVACCLLGHLCDLSPFRAGRARRYLC